METVRDVQAEIKALVDEHDVVLFMKGTPDFPQCGFSSTASQILNIVGAPYAAVNVLQDEDVRHGIKDYAQWPTIPQLYVKGEFVGGSDILREMYETGELRDLLKEKGVELAE